MKIDGKKNIFHEEKRKILYSAFSTQRKKIRENDTRRIFLSYYLGL